MPFKKEKIRNIALIGHSGEGKTSLLEAILFSLKATDRLGKVDDGNTVSDHDQEEINRKISISLSLANANYKDIKINLLDTPGFFDFEGEMVSALTVADSAIIVTTASGGVSVGAEKAIEYCAEKNIPCLLFVNGINKENSDFYKTLEAFKEKYPGKILPISLPIIEGGKPAGFVDVLDKKAYKQGAEIAIPASLSAQVEEANGTLLEMAAESDEALLEKFFGGEELTTAEKKLGVKNRFKSADFIPVMAGVAVAPVELSGLCDYIEAIFPSAGDGRGAGYTASDGSQKQMLVSEDGKFAAQVFKSVADQFGKLSLFKVVRGKISSGMQVYNSNAEESEKIASMYIIRGKKQDGADELFAGDMGALAKLNYTSTGDTLCDTSEKITFNPIEFPAPVISLAVCAQEKGAEEKVVAGLTKLLDEDSTFRLEKNIETGEMLISGLGESQLDILCKKLKNKFKVGATLQAPKIPYRETVKKSVEQQGKHKKQSGGHGQYGDVHIRFEPLYEGDFEFADEIVGGVVPKNYIPAVEKGLRESIVKGVLAGYPVTGLKATLFFGSYHDVDSSEMSFKLAAGIAYREGLPKASPVLLEPIMSVKVTVPENYMGDIMGDMNKRRGRILGMDSHNGKTVINAEAPHVEMARYATDLRSMTQGRGKFGMEFSRYEEVPALSAQKIIEEYKKAQASNA
ncbi:MAG: elongation factor G [Firmicutes bacterium]|nr:elongation factor G [Bacillota bacterium]